MSAAAHQRQDARAEAAAEEDVIRLALPPTLMMEMSRLYSSGYSLLPLAGADGKKPIVLFGRSKKRFPLSMVVDKITGAGSRSYGIRLNGLLVVDVDTDTPQAREYVEARFGSSPARIRTKRGFHLYFKHFGPKPKDVRLPGITIDFKSGENSFAVGPYSQRPDGTVYMPEGSICAFDALPKFRGRDRRGGDQKAEVRATERIQVGVRRDTLKKRAHQLALAADSFDDLVANLIQFREWEVERPEDFPDDELEGMARWFWCKREEGELWTGKDSRVLIHRAAIEELARRGEGTAFLLHALLCADHGHEPDRLFAIVPDGLRESGRLKVGRRQIYEAIDLLMELGLLHCRKRPRGNRNHYLYQLGTGAHEGDRGKGSKIILVPETDTHFQSSREGGLAA